MYNRLFSFRARGDTFIASMAQRERDRQADERQSMLRYAMETEFEATEKFFKRFGDVDLVGMRVLDFGCRFGGSSLWCARCGASHVIGVDIYEKGIEIAREFASRQEFRDDNPRVEFLLGSATSIPVEDNSIDLVISWDVVEHLEDPESIFREWWRVLAPGGRVLVSFGPLWYHPHGLHLWEIFPAPWTHVLFSDRTCILARHVLKADGNSAMSWMDLGLNKMTLFRFERLIATSRFRATFLQRQAVWKLKPLLWVPGVREYFASQVTCVLEK